MKITTITRIELRDAERFTHTNGKGRLFLVDGLEFEDGKLTFIGWVLSRLTADGRLSRPGEPGTLTPTRPTRLSGTLSDLPVELTAALETDPDFVGPFPRATTTTGRSHP